MTLIEFIEDVLDKMFPAVSSAATTTATIASVLASLTWLLTQALDFIRNNA